MNLSFTKPAILILSLGLLAGCASTEQLTKMEADIAKAQETADAALKAAKEAQLDAAAAQGTADSALSTANSAQASADEANERINRMSEKAMAK